jgi:hypothetical protein
MEAQVSGVCRTSGIRKPEAHLEEFLMQENYKPRIPVEHVTDAEIEVALRYLDPERSGATRSSKRDSVFAICFILITTVVSILSFMWLYLLAK